MGHFPHFLCDLRLFSSRLSDAQVLLTLVANPYAYTDKASDFVQEASTLQAAAKQDTDDASIPISHIDGQCAPCACFWAQLLWPVRHRQGAHHGHEISRPFTSRDVCSACFMQGRSALTGPAQHHYIPARWARSSRARACWRGRCPPHTTLRRDGDPGAVPRCSVLPGVACLPQCPGEAFCRLTVP